jgi:hypothetical protein
MPNLTLVHSPSAAETGGVMNTMRFTQDSAVTASHTKRLVNKTTSSHLQVSGLGALQMQAMPFIKS